MEMLGCDGGMGAHINHVPCLAGSHKLVIRSRLVWKCSRSEILKFRGMKYASLEMRIESISAKSKSKWPFSATV